MDPSTAPPAFVFMCRETLDAFNSGLGFSWSLHFDLRSHSPAGSWAKFPVFKGTVWYFQNIARVSPRQTAQGTRPPKSYVPFGYSLRSIELSWPMGIFWDLQRLVSRKGNFSTIGCTNHDSTFGRSQHCTNSWRTCDLNSPSLHHLKRDEPAHTLIFTLQVLRIALLRKWTFSFNLFTNIYRPAWTGCSFVEWFPYVILGGSFEITSVSLKDRS